MAESIDALNKKVERLLDGIDTSSLQGPSYDLVAVLFGDISLFSEQERQALNQCIASISEHVSSVYGGERDLLMQAADVELEQLYAYFNLKEALQRDDQDAASNYRKLLKGSTD